MKIIRVLVVDDSAVVRRVLTQALSQEADIKVVAVAANAELALRKLSEVQVDAVTLDVDMPDVNGLELLTKIRAQFPTLPVIMFSALTQKSAAITMEALARGASDYLPKPSGGSLQSCNEQIRAQLGKQIRALCRPFERVQPAAPKPFKNTSPGGRVSVVAIGVSTGGPNALVELFKSVPRDFPVPIVVVQHMPPLFTKLLAEQLSQTGELHFKEAVDGDVLQAGTVLIAPGQYHMRVVRDPQGAHVTLDQEAPENSCRPSVDVLFRSVAEAFGKAALAVVLTGMGQDGLRGCEMIREKRGQIVVQDEKTSVVWGMPGIVASAGLAHAILPLSDIAADLVNRSSKMFPSSGLTT